MIQEKSIYTVLEEIRPLNILLVDDDPDFVEAVKVIVENGGYDVRVAYDGQEGLEEVAEQKPDRSLGRVLGQHTSQFQDTHGADRVVVGARPRMIQVAGEMNLLIGLVRSPNRSRCKAIGTVFMRRQYPGVKQNLLSGCHALLQLARFSERDHEAEGFRVGKTG